MTKFTDSNTDGFTQTDLGVLNAALATVIEGRGFPSEFTIYSNGTDDAWPEYMVYVNGILNAWAEGDTVDTLVERFRRNHPTL